MHLSTTAWLLLAFSANSLDVTPSGQIAGLAAFYQYKQLRWYIYLSANSFTVLSSNTNSSAGTI
jgi:hypothetical protein